MQVTWFDGLVNRFIDRSMVGFGGNSRAQHCIVVSTIDFYVRLNGALYIQKLIPICERDHDDAVARK